MGSYPASCQCLGDLGGGRGPQGSDPDGCVLPEAYPYGEQGEEAVATDVKWLPPVLAQGLDAEEAAQAADAWALCADDLRRRTKLFVSRAEAGVLCRLVDPRTGSAVPARYSIDRATASFKIEEVHGQSRQRRECRLAEVQNIWVCSDSKLACRALGGTIHQGSADAELACIALIDVPEGLIGLVERSAEAREEFLDCMAVLIALQRLRSAPELACCGLPGRVPPPEAQLRPLGKSLRSVHLSGPICIWLARTGEGLLSLPRSGRAPSKGEPPPLQPD